MTGQRSSRTWWLTAALALSWFCAGCGVYSFSASTLPGYMKTVEVPLFANQTLEAGVAEQLTTELSTQVLGSGILRPVPRAGDATISGVVTSYSHREYQYDIKRAREVTVNQFIVTITASIEFTDNHKNESVYRGVLTGKGIYTSTTEQERDGRTRALQDLVRQVLENSVRSW